MNHKKKMSSVSAVNVAIDFIPPCYEKKNNDVDTLLMNQILLCRLLQKTDRKIDQSAKFYYTILYYVKKISGVEVELCTSKKYLF